MATGGKLEVQIGADKTDFEKKIKEVEFDIKELSKVKLQQIKVGLDTKEINAQIKDAKNNLNGLKTAIKDTGGQVGGQFTKQVGNGNNALMQFSRIAQDAPYGIIGIGNNITATAESFGYLKQQTGSTSGALKAMASSLAGTGGILLGVSLLTTGFTLLSQSGLSVGDIIDKVTGKFDAFGESVKKAREEGLKSAGKEIQSLNELVAVAQNENIAKKDRFIAVENLQRQYPAYFGNLSNEKILYGDLTSAVNATTSALVAKSIAEKLGDKAGDKFIERLNAQQKFNDSKNAIDKQDIYIQKLKESLEKQASSTTARVLAQAINLRKELVTKSEEERQTVIKLVKEYERYGNVINKLKQISAPSNRSAPKAQKATEAVAPRQSVEKIETNANLSPVPFTAGEQTIEAITNLVPTVDTELDNMLILMQQFSSDVESIVTGSLASTFENLGTSIGEALATGGNVLNAIGNTLLTSLGNFLSDMGGLLIKYGTLAIVKGKLDLAIATGGPVSIGAGIAAIAVGVLLKAAGGAIGSRAQSGSSSTSTATGSGSNNYQSSGGGSFSSNSSGGGTVVFEISGQALIGVLSNTLDKNKRLGGSLSL